MLKVYPVAGKLKSHHLCNAFLSGSPHEAMGDIFYGVDASNTDAFKRSTNFYYLDNSFFDSTRQKYFRITRNAFQPTIIKPSDGERFNSLGIAIKPWRIDGNHILIVMQSDSFLAFSGGLTRMRSLQKELKSITDRRIIISEWNRNKSEVCQDLPPLLSNAYCLITWSSAAAITAILEGVPAISFGQSAASSMGNDLLYKGLLSGLLSDNRRMPDNRYEWACWLADNQFTIPEMRDGIAWRMIHG